MEETNQLKVIVDRILQMATSNGSLISSTVLTCLGRKPADLPSGLLFVAYGLPALFAMAFALEFRHQGMAVLGRAAAGVAFLLVFVQITLEVRRLFHGPDLTLGATSDAEWYAYSIVWLIYAGILLAAGILRGTPELRYGSLALVLFTVAKVFVWDMSALTGLYRALSFLGLGACLVGIGYLYQRFVFPPRQQAAAAPPPRQQDRTPATEA